MLTSKIDREVYKKNKIKELMSLGTESDNEWFEENNLLSQGETETETENENYSNENKGEEDKSDLLIDINNFDYTDTISSRLDAFQEKINAMLAEGNKMLNQNVTRKNVDLSSYSPSHSSNHKKHRHRSSHNKQKVAFASDIVSSDSDFSNSSSSNDNTLKSTLTNKKSTETSVINKQDNETVKLRKTSNSDRNLDCRSMLKDAISFYKSVVNADINKITDTKNDEKSTNTTKPTTSNSSVLNSVEKNNSNKSESESNNNNSNDKENSSKSTQNNIDSLLNQSLKDGDSILQNNELELLRIEIKELKEKNKQLQKENMNLKIHNSSLVEKQKQQEQQIEKLKQKNSKLKFIISDLNNIRTTRASSPASPYLDNGNSQEVLSQSSDADWNNNPLSPSSTIISNYSNYSNSSNNIMNTINKNGFYNDTASESSVDNNNNNTMLSNKSIKNIKRIENHRRYSSPQRPILRFSSNESLDSSIRRIRAGNRSNSYSMNNPPPTSQKNKSNNNENNKKHPIFADIYTDIKNYEKIIEGWKQKENSKDNTNTNRIINNQFDDTIGNGNHDSDIENIKTDSVNNNSNNTGNDSAVNKSKQKNRYSLVYPNPPAFSNNDKTKRSSFLSDISPLRDVNINDYVDKLNSPEARNQKTRVRRISESYANDIRHRENILKNLSLSPPKFKYSDKDLDLMTESPPLASSLTSQSNLTKEEKANKRKQILEQMSSYNTREEKQIRRRSIFDHSHPFPISASSNPDFRGERMNSKRRSILDQISTIQIDDESINQIKNKIPHHTQIGSSIHKVGDWTDSKRSSYSNYRRSPLSTPISSPSSTPTFTPKPTPKTTPKSSPTLTSLSGIETPDPETFYYDSHGGVGGEEERMTRGMNVYSEPTREADVYSEPNNAGIHHISNRLSHFKSQIQNVQKDLLDMVECEKRIQDILIPIDNMKK